MLRADYDFAHRQRRDAQTSAIGIVGSQTALGGRLRCGNRSLRFTLEVFGDRRVRVRKHQ